MWDAAFAVTHNSDIGFDLTDTPFGEDNFDFIPIATPLRYCDFFTGMVYYTPFAQLRITTGLPNFVDDNFAREVQRRYTLEGNIAPDAEILKEQYNTVTERTLAQAIAGKYVNVNGREVIASGYGISEPIVINAGDILLIPSAQAVPADVSVVARKITRTYDKVITYAYTTDEQTGRYLTATADYDPMLVYSAIYDGEGAFLYWIYNGVHYEQLPTTHEVTESMYEPLMKQSVSAMPSTGYYVYLCPVGMTVVISGLTATVSGGVALVMGLGIFKNIATNFIGAPGQAVIAQAFAQLLGEIQGIVENLKHMGSFKATDIDCENMPKVCGYPLVVDGAGAPSIVPRFVGQRYHDTTNNKCYEAFAVTNSTANWVLLN
jgi:hypothetical protein